jgi:hypothetical protein
MFLDEVRNATTGFVRAEEKGPMSVSLVTPTEVVIVDIVFGPSAAARLRAGTPLAELLAGLNSLQKAETRIPLSGLQSLCWTDRENGVQITWLDEHQRLRRKTTYIAQENARVKLVDCVADQLGCRPQVTSSPAGFWRMAWSQLLGAALSVILTAVFLYFWDAEVIGRVGGGNIALWLGPKGCAAVGAAFFVACLVSAWRRLTPRPMQHCWRVRITKG